MKKVKGKKVDKIKQVPALTAFAELNGWKEMTQNQIANFVRATVAQMEKDNPGWVHHSFNHDFREKENKALFQFFLIQKKK